MRMLRYPVLVVCVVCIAAFASGCGGGGGTPVACPVGQVGTPPNCADPGPTDEEKIEAARQELSGILTNAQARAQAASSAAAAIQTNADATPEQITDAISHSTAAQSALALIVSAKTAATTATTPAQANTALANAKAAQSTLNTSASAISSIQGAVQAATNRRQQQAADELALTNGSSLIKHVRDNKLLSKALLDDLASAEGGNNRIDVRQVGTGSVGNNAGKAEYPADSVSDGVRNVGQRTVYMQGLISNSKTPPLTGTGRLPHGFDLNNGTTTFVDAYTDITKTVSRSGDNPRTSTEETKYEIPDADYLLAGTWLSVGTNIADSTITAFAYGNQAITNTYQINSVAANACTNAEGTDTIDTATNNVTHTRTCTEPTGFDLISDFVQDGKDITATYRGDANGIYIAAGETSYFRADVELTAEFQNPITDDNAADGTGSIQGEVSNIKAGGQQIEGNIELQKLTLGNNISSVFTGVAAGVIEGKIYSGGWKGQFFGMRYKRETPVHTPAVKDTQGNVTTPQSTATKYSPLHPGSVAGTFQVIKQSTPVGDAAFIGSFGANR